jgi:predicted DNA-binding protein (MmcQ/YjbR family)
MKTEALKKVCRSLPGATEKRYEAPSNVLCYYVGGRLFAYFKTSEPERWRFSVRVSPARFIELTDQPGIKPARYRGRHHWVTIVHVHAMPEAYLRELLQGSYEKALASLSQKKRESLTEKS